MGLSFSDPVVGGTVLVRSAIQSPNFVTGVSGWIIRQDGTVEFDAGLFRGDVYVSDGGGGYTQITASYLEFHGPAWATVPGDEKARIIPISGFPMAGSQMLHTGPIPHLGGCAQSIAIGSDAGSGAIRIAAGVSVQLNTPTVTTSAALTVTTQATARNYVANVAGGSGGIVGFSASNSRIIGELTAGTGPQWIDQNFVASNPGGNAGWAMRTAPVAAQFRLGNTGPNDVFLANAVGGGGVPFQAGAFVIFSRGDSKQDVAELAEHVPDALASIRALRPVRYKALGAGQDFLTDPADFHHTVPAKMRGRNAMATVQTIRRRADLAATHYGFVAEEVADVLPEAIHPAHDGAEVGGYSLGAVVAVLVAAVQQLADRVEGPHPWT